MTGAGPQDGQDRPSRWRADRLRLDPSSPYYVRPTSSRRLRAWGAVIVVVPVPAFAVAVVVALVQHRWGAAAVLSVMLLVFTALRWFQLARILAELRRRRDGSGRRTGS